MNRRVTLDLPDELFTKVLRVAGISQRELEDVLLEWIDRYADDLPVEELPDDEVMALCHYEMNMIHQQELRNLLYHHQEDQLSAEQSVRLDDLLNSYRRSIVRKARAVEVASSRGLLNGNGANR
jgi:hypothetical protein